MAQPKINGVTLPRQRLPFAQKNKQWRIDNVDHADSHSLYNSESVRQTLKNKMINLNLFNGIVDIRDLTNVINPHQIDASFVPDNIPHHPIMVPKIELLIGEEIKRRFDWSCIVTNPDAITKKEEDKKAYLFQKLTEFLQGNYSDQELEAKMKELEKHMKYNWQDIREKMCNQILRHYWQEHDFESKFTNGFKDALLFGEEIYLCDIVHGEPIMEKLNPLKVRSVMSGNSDKIEDSSLIIIEDHWSPHKIVDNYHDELKTEDIDYILNYSERSTAGEYSDDGNNHVLLRDSADTDTSEMYGSLFNMGEIHGHKFGSNFTDENGNIRVLRVFWKSLKKIQKVKYYDELGEEQFKTMSEEYIPNVDLGEEVKPMWVNEWWEGVKIGKDVYLNIKPRKVQYNNIHNPSYCHPGIIGQIYNTNQGKAVSLVDRMKNYQYTYDAMWDRLNKAIATNYGKIMELDIAKVPENWEVEKWLHFAFVNKIAVIDSFKEGNQGNSTGKLAGNMNTQGGRVMDMETGSYIQQHVQLLEFIKMEMGEIAGVSSQREGQVSNRETMGGIERAVNQSSHITEYWFMTHEKAKIRVLNCFLETAKVALKGNNKKVQYILDDQTIEVLNLEADEFCENSYGLVITSSSRTMELEAMIKANAQAFLQNGGGFSTLMDISFAPSLMDMRRKLEIAEDDMNTRNAEAGKQQSEQAQAALQAQIATEDKKMALEDALNLRDNETKLNIKRLEMSMQPEESLNDGVADPLDGEKFELDKEKVKNSHFEKMVALRQDMDKHKDNMDAKKVDQSISRIQKKSTK